jgi:DNA segregation ATPase FtsK/SpoIIIE-like protein
MQTTVYSPQEEQLLMSRLWSPRIKNDPLAFVMLVFPWGEKNTPLENFTGPRKWQREILREIADHVKKNAGAVDPSVLRMATASGRGIGKSALVSWIVLWFFSTRIGGTTIVSANSESQLRSVTWAEITKWLAMAINKHWFEISATRVSPAKWITELVERDLKKGTRYWSVEGRLWSEENPDAYAGVHNYDGVLLLFDEAAGVPDAIWQVAAGFFSEPTEHRFWLAFSNPRRNSGYFFECFHGKRDFWNTRQIDSRSVEGTDKNVYEQIIAEYGEDSREARVEVYGQFPSDGDDQFITPKLVDEAMARPKWKDADAPIVLGVDPARTGGDSTVIAVRQGRDLLALHRYRGDDTMTVVGHVIEAIERYRPAMTVIDEGGLGYGILDRLNEQRYKVRGVNFGWKSSRPVMWGNKRAEMWGALRDWLRTAAVTPDKALKTDLTGVRAKPDSTGKIFLESKKEMKARGLASPDAADAIAVTFAFPIRSDTDYAATPKLSAYALPTVNYWNAGRVGV